MKRIALMRRFRTQILGMFIVAILIPMIVLTVYLYNSMVRSTEASIFREAEIRSTQWMENYLLRCEQVCSLGYTIANNPTITKYMNSTQSDDAATIKTIRYSFQPMVEWLISTNDLIYRVHFFTSNMGVAENKYVSYFSRHAGQAWFEELCRCGVGGTMLPLQQAHAFPNEAAVTQPMVVSYQVRLRGVIPAAYMQLDVRDNWLYDDISIIVDSADGKVLYSAENSDWVGRSLDVEQLVKATDTHEVVTIGDSSFYISIVTSSQDDLLFIDVLPAAEFHQHLQTAQVSYIIICMVLVILMIAVVWFIARHVTKRIERIGMMIEKISGGDYKVFYQKTYDDEIDFLGTCVQEMGVKIDRLVNQGLRQSLLMREAEYNALQAQINPHFIFNTLESYQMLAELQDLREVSDSMAVFGRLMRYSLEHSAFSTLRAEIQNITEYVSIQNLNKNNRIVLAVFAQDDLLDERVLRLLLQPIVENAIIHGMPSEGQLRIEVHITSANGEMELCIANNGKLMTFSEEQHLNALLKEAREVPLVRNTRSIALQNIQRRLMIQYGEACVIRIQQSSQQGFSVRFLLPLRRENGT